MKWFRFYSEFRSDTKIKRLPIAHRYAFVILLCLANEDKERGCITRLDDEDIAFELEMELEDWQTLKSKFRAKGFIEPIQGGIKIGNWDKRQFASDSSAERVKRHRASKKKRECNVTETLAKRDVTPSDTDTESDTYTEEIVDPANTACAPAELTSMASEDVVLDSGTASRVKKGTTAQVLAKLPESSRTRFEKFWSGYCKFCKERQAKSGSKKAAALAWSGLARSDFNGHGLEGFEKGVKLFAKSQGDSKAGIPHACRFLHSTRNGTGAWEDALEQEKSSQATTSFGSDGSASTGTNRIFVAGQDEWKSDMSQEERSAFVAKFRAQNRELKKIGA